MVGATALDVIEGRARWSLALGDCVEGLRGLPDRAVDHVLTDPPYARDVYLRAGAPKTKKGSGTPGRLGLAEAFDRNSGPRIAQLAAGAIGHIDEMVDPLGVEFGRLARRWVLVFSDAETLSRWRESIVAGGLRYVRTGAWVKPDPMPQFSGDRPAVGFEPCTIGHAQGPMRWNGGGKAATWTHGTVKKDRPDHPCPKPLALMEELILLFTDEDDLVCDPFSGSATTALACQRHGRRFVGWEIDPGFHATAIRRLTGGDARRVNPRQTTIFDGDAA